VTNVLFICTGNICRSPTAATFLAARTKGNIEGIEVASAGTLDLDQASPDEVIAAAAELGVDMSSHLSHRFTLDDLAAADLIIGMAREHVREVVLACPPIWPRTFTLPELVRRGHAVGPRDHRESLADWLARVHEGRHHADLLGNSDDDDIPDPIGGPPSEYRASAGLIAGLVDELVELAWSADLPPIERPTSLHQER
jgi:protein-tyrosine phosphatase